MDLSGLATAMERVWEAARLRFPAYHLVLPGTPSFICEPAGCRARCCHAFSVTMGEADAARFTAETGLGQRQFLELEDGQPIRLPLAQPYVLARDGGRCRFLGESLACTVYSGRPDACRLYPHFIVFWDEAAARPRTPAIGPGYPPALPEGLVPLLIGHGDCPGFTGPPLGASSWEALFRQTLALQGPAAAG